MDDVEAPWGYEEMPFDYIHARFLVGGIKDMPKLVEQSYKLVDGSRFLKKTQCSECADGLQLP